MSQRKLQAWRDAGLIDAETMRRISDYEAAHSKPLALWAVIGLGALAIGLGLISVVAANWDALSGQARLAIHLALLAIVGGWMFWQSGRDTGERGDPTAGGGQPFFSDAGLFIFGLLALTFFGHLGQVYQTSSPLWQPLLVWLALLSPALLYMGRGWLAALAWMAGISGTAISYATWRAEGGPAGMDNVIAMVLSIPPLVIVFASFLRGRSLRENFWRRTEQIAMILVVIGVSLFHLFAEISRDLGNDEISVVKIAGMLIVTFGIGAALVFLIGPAGGREPKGRHAVAAIIAAAAISNLLAAMNGGESSTLAAMIFLAFWTVIAAMALYASWRFLFQAAVAVISLRLIALSFQLGADLLGSGIGFIVAGVLTLGIAWAAVRFMKRYAPEADDVDNEAPAVTEGEAA